MPEIDFDNQQITLPYGESKICISSTSNIPEKYDHHIQVSELYKGADLFIQIVNDSKVLRSAWLSDADGGFYLHTKSDTDESQSVKLWQNALVMSLGSTLVSLNTDTLELNWMFRPNNFGLFEFYDLEDDILLRGELDIYRIGFDGAVKWSLHGRDIWVNIDGKREVTIQKDTIQLIDFEGNEYVIDFNGKLLEDIPYKKPLVSAKKYNPWWQFWK